jgi:hypothetical protein
MFILRVLFSVFLQTSMYFCFLFFLELLYLDVNTDCCSYRLVYFAGRVRNSQVRQQLINLWGNYTQFDIFNGSSTFPYEEGFKGRKYCLHVRGL